MIENKKPLMSNTINKKINNKGEIFITNGLYCEYIKSSDKSIG